MPEDKCIFCQIISKEIPATIRYEDSNWLAFDDLHKAAPEHILLVPKKPIKSLEDIDINNRDLHADLLIVAKRIAKEVGISENYKLFTNSGEQVQAVHHLHLHIMGGWKKEKNRLGLDKESLDFINS
jgi:histidine triad (HIT) family protein